MLIFYKVSAGPIGTRANTQHEERQLPSAITNLEGSIGGLSAIISTADAAIGKIRVVLCQ